MNFSNTISTLFERPNESNFQYIITISGPSTARIGNTVLVKLPNGQTKSMTRLPKRPLELMKVPKSMAPTSMPAPRPGKSPMSLKRPGSHLTPSVSIAPVPGSKKPPVPLYKPPHSDSESEGEDFGGLYPRKKGKIKMNFEVLHLNIR